MSGDSGTMVPENADITTGEIRPPADLRLSWQQMNRDQAVEATNRVNTYAKRLPQVVKEAFDGRAWIALGYESWDEYVDDALVITRRYANMLLAAAVNLELLSEMFDIDVALFGIPERVLRGLDVGNMVPEIEGALAELTDPTERERAEVVETTVRTESMRVTKAKQEATSAERLAAAEERGRQKALADLAARNEREAVEAAEAEAERQRRAAERAARKNSDGDSRTPSDPGQAPPPAPGATPEGTPDCASDEGLTGSEGNECPSAVPDATEGAAPSTAAGPVLPPDWRDLIGHAAYLLRLDIDLLRAALNPDDRADLTELRDHLNAVLNTQEQNP